MLWTSDWEEDGRDGEEAREPQRGVVRVVYMNIVGGVHATHEFLEGCSRHGVVVAFVGEYLVEKRSGSGT